MPQFINKILSLLDERSWSIRKSLLFLTVATLLILAPFANKAFNIDDPLFIRLAKNIQLSPLDPYGFKINWYYTAQNASGIIKNPPLASYYMALAGGIFGWSQKALHLVFLIPAIAAVLGIYFLARKLCVRPVLAAILGLTSPGFMTSATSVSCDVIMLAFWVWAAVFWIEGVDKNKQAITALSAVFIAAATLTKYSGIILVLPVFIYTLVKKPFRPVHLAYLLIPAVVLVFYQYWTGLLYGRGLLSDAFTYAAKYQSQGSLSFPARALVGLSFSGGSLFGLFFLAPLLWSKKSLIISLLVFVAVGIAFLPEKIWLNTFCGKFDIGYFQKLQFCLFVFIGVSAFCLLAARRRIENNKEALLLLLWFIGIFIFAGFLNWTTNVRSLILAIPVIAIFASQRLGSRPVSNLALALALSVSVLFSVGVAFCDYQLANSAKEAANKIYLGYGLKQEKVFFQGHWGFQYYMEEKGFKAIDIKSMPRAQGDIIVVPENNTNTFTLSPQKFSLLETIEIPVCRWVSTMNSIVGAGFYSDAWGPLPFAAGAVPGERYHIFTPL